MKIVTWNCNGAFRKKFDSLSNINANIYILQECEDPARCADQAYKNWAENYLWLGNNKNSGLSVFAAKNISLKLLEREPAGLELFIPLTIND